MSAKSTITYWVLFALLGAYYLTFERRPAPPSTAELEREKVLNVFADEVTRLTLVRGGKEIRCERRDKRWQVVEPQGVTAPSDLVAALVDTVATQREAEEMVARPKPEDLREFGLADDTPRLDLELADGTKHSVKIGSRNPPQTAVYVQTDVSPRVLLAGLNVQYYTDLLYAAASKDAVARKN